MRESLELGLFRTSTGRTSSPDPDNAARTSPTILDHEARRQTSPPSYEPGCESRQHSILAQRRRMPARDAKICLGLWQCSLPRQDLFVPRLPMHPLLSGMDNVLPAANPPLLSDGRRASCDSVCDANVGIYRRLLACCRTLVSLIASWWDPRLSVVGFKVKRGCGRR
ncbi:hypothetical protein PYCCODRAFT_914940 [Trametes coccinea BRFM310]|uniref:Uncharacterized protein n=1 Tax=Trametes coccinea (strain BRFM310) TaxID=1353009 RepID=A0A1Y2IDN1_TRAC3|nr:hypothetical protein PYCCODRAFT_914940 [Trametes coccinea BRFM310]